MWALGLCRKMGAFSSFLWLCSLIKDDIDDILFREHGALIVSESIRFTRSRADGQTNLLVRG